MRFRNKVGRVEIIALLVSLGCLLTAFALQANINYQKSVVRRQATDLAKSLGINIQKYNPDEFPVDYFQSALTQGMPVNTVHQIVRGYAMSLVCPHTYSEVYYFYSKSENGKKVEISYDLKDETFLSMSVDDNNSLLIHTDGCKSGLLGE